ncbi:MAG: (2Fe-2S)-binding protein [Bacteroidota bacterium]
MDVHIDRCYCFSTTFDELKAVAASTGAATVEDLQDHAVFGHNCQLCHPYVRRMLRTGQVVFQEIVTAEDEPEDEVKG